MRFKVDENLPVEAADLLRHQHHDAMTILEQRMAGYADGVVAQVCQQELRALITLDLDFADIRCYPPESYCGIIVLRPANQGISAVLRLVRRVLLVLDKERLAGRLWIVDEHQVRIRGGDAPINPNDHAPRNA